MTDVIVNMNYATTRQDQNQKCLFCGDQLPDTAWFVMIQTGDSDLSTDTYEVYCDESCHKAKGTSK